MCLQDFLNLPMFSNKALGTTLLHRLGPSCSFSNQAAWQKRTFLMGLTWIKNFLKSYFFLVVAVAEVLLVGMSLMRPSQLTVNPFIWQYSLHIRTGICSQSHGADGLLWLFHFQKASCYDTAKRFIWIGLEEASLIRRFIHRSGIG